MVSINRREALKGASAGVVASLVSRDTKANGNDPLVGLLNEWKALNLKILANEEAYSELAKSIPDWYRLPPRTLKQALQIPHGKFGVKLRTRDLGNGHLEILGGEDVMKDSFAEMRREIEEWEAEQTRAFEVLQQRRKDYQITSGLKALEDVIDNQVSELAEIEGRIMDTPATTYAGVAAKMYLANTHICDFDMFRVEKADLDWSEALLLGAYNDAQRLGGVS